MRQVIAFVECVLCVLCILPVREQRVAPVQPRRKGWTLPSDAFRCVLGSADVVQPRPLSPVNASLTRDGYDMDAIPALKATRKPRTVKPVPVQAVKVARKATPRKATQVAAQTVATETPVYVAPETNVTALSDGMLLDMLRGHKVKGASPRWKRETMLAKLRAIGAI